MTIIEQLVRDEGLRLKPYHCTEGKLTIGIGRNIEDRGISVDEAEYMLANDIRDVDREIAAALPWTAQLDRIRYYVLVNMGFMGVPRLLGFKNMLAAMKRGDWKEAAAQLLDSKYARQVGERADRLAKQLVTGEWQ